MKTRKLILFYLFLCLNITVSGQVGNLKTLGKKIQNEKTDQTKKPPVNISKSDIPEELLTETKDDNNHTLPKLKETIIFSKTPFDPIQPGESINKFNVGEPIYAFVQLPKKLSAIFNIEEGNKADVEIFIYEVKPPLYSYLKEPQEEQLAYSTLRISGSSLENDYIIIDIVPQPNQTNAYGNPDFKYKEFGKKFDGPANFAENFGKLEPGKRNFKIVVRCRYEDTAFGNISISGDDFGIYKEIANELNAAASNAASSIAVMPKAEKSDAALEKQMLEAFKESKDWANNRFDAKEILSIAIYDKDWHIRRHQISGIVLHRYIRAAIAYKTKSGQCAYVIATFQEDYISNKFQPLKYDGTTEKVFLDCKNISR
jgi:hypothetical protein